VTVYLDASVLVAAVIEAEPNHAAALQLLGRKKLSVWTHGLAEVYATLTGGRLGIRVSPAVASRLIAPLADKLQLVELAGSDIVTAIAATEEAGVRGGALYDYLHLIAARKVSATTLFTLNVRHFAALARSGDPLIELPTA
jgi:predicted nucleic acid-binding protein